MNKILILTFIILNISGCSLNKVVKHHGINNLEKKEKKLIIDNTNKNDVQKILGTPSTKSTFDNDVWIYIERKTTVSKVTSLGRKKVLVNNALILEFDNRGLLVKKDFFDKSQMNKLKISKDQTEVLDKKRSFITNVLTSLRQKINDPLGKRKAK